MAAHRHWLNNLPAPHGVLKEVQKKARESLLNVGIPNRKIEEWRLTDIKQLEKILTLPIDLGKKLQTDQHLKIIPEKLDNTFRILTNEAEHTLNKEKLPQGITLLSPEEIENFLMQDIDQYLALENWSFTINLASTNKIIALKVENDNVQPLELITKVNRDLFSPTRIIILLEKKAKLDLLQIQIGSQNSAQNNLTEIYLAEESELNHGLIAMGAENASLMSMNSVKQKAKSKYNSNVVQQGWLLGRLEQKIVQLEGQAKTNLQGLQVAKGNEQLTTLSSVTFNGPEGCVEQLQKSAASEISHCVFNGGIQVPRKAQKTNASQLSRNLLLSNKARIDTKPELKIIADNVQCTHGATVSQMQEDELFYLQSRGIRNQDAISLLLEGYCQEVISNLPLNANRWEVLKKILRPFQS